MTETTVNPFPDEYNGMEAITELLDLKITYPDLIFFITEGPSDKKLFLKFLDRDRSYIYPIHGKKNIYDIFPRLPKESFYAIVDADFFCVDKELYLKETRILYTDTHDNESLLLISPALESFLIEYADEEKIDIFQNKCKKSIREVILDSATPIGMALWRNNQKKLYINFDALEFSYFVDLNTLELDVSRLVQELSHQKSIDHKNWEEFLKRMLTDHEKNKLCFARGHDMVKLLLKGLKTIFGNEQMIKLKTESDVERELRLAYNIDYFKKTRLYKNLEEIHKITPILKSYN
ncbi:MAG: DUF4435 domain-containing protein [Chloroherpetonaceae bacterium]